MASRSAHGGNATWSLNPTSNLWNTAENWTPATVPNSEDDIATFGPSNISEILVGLSADFAGAENKVNAIVFAPDATAYTLISTASESPTYYSDLIEFYGAGIVNNSGKTQHFVVAAAPGADEQQPAVIFFHNTSSAGEDVVITNQGSASSIGIGAYGGATKFGLFSIDSPSAGKATVINEGGKVSGTIEGGIVDISDFASADAATFINQPGEVDGAAAGSTLVITGGSLGTSTFLNNGAAVAGAEGGWTEIQNGVCAGTQFIANGATSTGAQGGQVYTYGGSGYGSFTAMGGRGNGVQGGLIEIHNLCNSVQTIVTGRPGNTGGLGGMITINGLPSTLDQVQFILLGNSTMDLSGLSQNSVTIGSLSGKGTITLGGFLLNIGGNSVDTKYSGTIQNAGSIGKVGSGSLSLAGANTYTGGTTITAGTLAVTNRSGSATGTGLVKVTSGTLGGAGTIAGPVRVGSGSGTGAFLDPSVGSNNPTTLTLQANVTFKADSTYSCKLNTRNAQLDQLAANGVKIENGARFSCVPIGSKRLPVGTTFTAIDNTSTSPVRGTFANLTDGSILPVGRNNLQVDYSGGDGNDLTLTVVQ